MARRGGGAISYQAIQKLKRLPAAGMKAGAANLRIPLKPLLALLCVGDSN